MISEPSATYSPGETRLTRLGFGRGILPDPTVALNSGFKFFARVVNLLAAMAIGILVARFWGAEALGLYAGMTVVATFVGFIFDPGLSDLLFREIATDRARASELVMASMSLIVVLTIPGVIVLSAVAAAVFGTTPLTLAVAAAAGVWLALGALNATLFSVFLAFERMGLEARASVLERTLMLPLAVLVVTQTTSMPSLFLVAAAARLVVLMLTVPMVRSMIGPMSVRYDPVLIGQSLRQGLPFWVHSFFTAAYIQQSILLLTLLATLRDVGLFRSASVFTMYAVVLPVALNAALFPGLVRHWADGNIGRVVDGVKSSLLMTGTAGLAVGGVLALGAGLLIPALFGESFTPAVPALTVLAIGLPFSFMNNSLGMLLTVSQRQHFRAATSGLGAVAAVALNLSLIPRHGFMGAAVATAMTEVLVVAALIACCWPVLKLARERGCVPSPAPSLTRSAWDR